MTTTEQVSTAPVADTDGVNPTRETSVSTLELMPSGILLWQYKRDSVVTMTEAQEEADTIQALFDAAHWDGRCWLLIDISKMRSIDRASRRFFASEEVHTNFGVQGLALVMGSPIGTMIGNIYHAINKTVHPTRLFTTQEKAAAWLSGLIKTSDAGASEGSL